MIWVLYFQISEKGVIIVKREKRKILKIYQEVFHDDEEIMGFINEGGI